MTADPQRRVERAIWIYLACLAFLTALAWVPLLIHWGDKAYFPLSPFSERFSDLAHFAKVHQKLASPSLEDIDHLTGTMFPRNYGSLAILLYLFLLGVCSPYGIVVFLAIFFTGLIAGSYILWRSARSSYGYRPFMVLAIFGTSLFAFPTAETVMRGNLEGFLWFGYAAGIGYMFLCKWGKSATVLAIASCIKPYPALLFAVLLQRRKYKQVLLGCLVMLLTTIGCLTLIGKGSPRQGTQRIYGGSSIFFAKYIVGFRDVHEMTSDHSLLQTSKLATRVIKARGFHLPEEDYRPRASLRAGYILLAIYLPCVFLFLVWVFWRIWNMPFLNRIFALSICLTLCTLIAADYTMTILYVPMGFFLLFLLREVSTARVSFSQARMLSILILCAWLMSPTPLFGIWAGGLRSLVLLCLLLIVMDTPMPMSIDFDETDGKGVGTELNRMTA
jgi:hypothetical protein